MSHVAPKNRDSESQIVETEVTIQNEESEDGEKKRPSTWVTSNYPSRALEEKMEGVVTYKLLVGIDGRAKECTILESSGHEILDRHACANLIANSRFSRPAIDDEGNFIEGDFVGRIRYKIGG
ncbi:energy transducer TonB [Alterisphingorhabdus coralli]|uniref:Energy transducer TonB n=1 Tax=Alterisphingorhabdus coralli TaxID=3071408 RepID=A0AA97F635_9SPHN|nr:energy transducer TonB [Parasphingorhabdus sp. SCSIO 66989]WOE75074.1 energy transducer TonB [Parasphingorhabdus sp. SCSIO 66989]